MGIDLKNNDESRRWAGSVLAILIVGLLCAAFGFAQTSQSSSPVFLSGKVEIEGGAPLLKPVAVEIVCQGKPQPQGYTDRYGVFGFFIGASRDQVQRNVAEFSVSDTARFGGSVSRRQPNGGSERALVGCGLRAVLEGYESTVIDLSGWRAGESREIGTVMLTRLGLPPPPTVSVASMGIPAKARKAFEKGVRLAEQNKLAEAEKQLITAVRVCSVYEEAWQKLGQVKALLGQPAQARQCFENAIAVRGLISLE